MTEEKYWITLEQILYKDSCILIFDDFVVWRCFKQVLSKMWDITSVLDAIFGQKIKVHVLQVMYNEPIPAIFRLVHKCYKFIPGSCSDLRNI